MKVIRNLRLAALCACLLAISPPARASSVQLGNMQADRIVVLGNSITSCGPNGWGLSASTPEKDTAKGLPPYGGTQKLPDRL